MSLCASPSRVVWTVVALATPRVHRRCPRCDAERAFLSSDRFRVNAHQRRLDVWLIYKCVACDDTWKLAVVERATPEDIGASRLEAYHRNTCDVAWDCAFDPRLLARAGGRVAWDVPYRLDAEPGSEIALALPRPVRVRLERLLADGLGVSRSRLGDWVARGVVRLEGGRACLRRPASDGQVIRVDGDPLTLALSPGGPGERGPEGRTGGPGERGPERTG